jgi:hypothetical protein
MASIEEWGSNGVASIICTFVLKACRSPPCPRGNWVSPVELTGWRIRGFGLIHLGEDDVLPFATEGGFPEITNEHSVQ